MSWANALIVRMPVLAPCLPHTDSVSYFVPLKPWIDAEVEFVLEAEVSDDRYTCLNECVRDFWV